MSEKIYTLSDVPFEQAALLMCAFSGVEQQPLLKMMGRRRKYSRSKLIKLAEYGVGQKAIESVKVRLHDGSIETVVNQRTFPTEFSAFLEKVAGGEAGLSRTQVRRILRSGRSYKRALLRYIHSTPILLRISERFCRDLDAFINLVDVSRFRAVQNHSEIRGLLELLADRRPKTLLEIGTNKGGSLYLLTKVADSAAAVVSVDIHIENKKLLNSFARKQQRLMIIEADSTAPETIVKIRSIFEDGVDFLFLDGDHSFEGIKKDFENYWPLVRPGGLVALHDIIEDANTRYGVCTGGWVGGVPTFWRELKPRFRHVEFIDHPEQDGRGIGVLFKPQA